MRKITCLFIVFVFFIGCKTANLLNAGTWETSNALEEIPVRFVNDLPLITVTINGKDYVFLFDTGAPTVISTAIYKDLNLKPTKTSNINDSQGNSSKQILTSLPEMKIGNATFSNIGCVVVDFNVPELNCYNIAGIVGANQMSSAFWKVDYANKAILLTKDIHQFNLEEHNLTFSFSPKSQKTPLISTTILGEKLNFTFDTGFSGNLKISKHNKSIIDSIKKLNPLEIYGSTAVGIYGTGKIESNYLFKTDTIVIDSVPFTREIIGTGESSLIGNSFLKNYTFILDWEKRKIYLKEIKQARKDFESFGFGIRYVNNVPTVASVYKIENNPIELDDIILQINNINLENLDTETACKYYIEKLEKDADFIDVKLKRNDSILQYKIEKKAYFKE